MNEPVKAWQRTSGIQGAYPANRPASQKRADANNGLSFEAVLNSQLKFSNHAEQRLQQRGIQLMPDQLQRIASAVEDAAAKGAKDSLVIYRNVAMIVNVPSRTVVTALDERAMKSHVFTQIDSAVVVSEQ